jgi:hypothetical protein
MTPFRPRMLFALLGLAALIVAWATITSPPQSLLAQTGDGSASTDNSGVNAEIAELRSALAESETDLAAAQAAIGQLQEALAAVQAKLEHVHVADGEINGLAGPHLIFEGCNVHVRSGSGHTYVPEPSGLGNLIVGYNENSDAGGRNGAHNVIVGLNHTYTGSGGLVAGRSNTIEGNGSSVLGGIGNAARGWYSTCSGGGGNEATGFHSSVCGGGGNEATGSYSTVCGGLENVASSYMAVVSGGYSNEAAGDYSSVSGGTLNGAFGIHSSVSGGYERFAVDYADWAAGSLFQDD